MAQAAQTKVNGTASTLYVAFELSEKNWKLVFSDGARMSEAGTPARDVAGSWPWLGDSSSTCGGM